MKKTMHALIALVLTTTLASTVFATVRSKTATLYYSDIKITLNGQEILTKDVNGNVVEPFSIDGTTYLPIRGVASALGLDVDWDKTTNTVILKNGETSTSSSNTTPTQTSSQTETIGQKNAVEKAKSYLSVSAFSRNGMIEHLEFLKFSHDEAVYGADHCGADWFEQAAKKAASYLEVTSFSRDGLIEQLEFLGFTNEQAIYGVKAVGY